LKTKLNIKILSDSKDTSLINTAISQIESPLCETAIFTSNELSSENADYIIVQISSKDSKVLNQIIANRDQLSDKLIFVLTFNNAILSTTLAKLGFNELFLFPDELFQFTSYITDLIENHSSFKNQSSVSYGIESIIGKGENSEEQIKIAKKVGGHLHSYSGHLT
jgi:hypothetical protein